ncbi:hypothetical protein KCP70_04450 [Salmonella enterica subsp. enterica]|nr:hypothetical protein KCP70_04450 [Salmonella enterica subsp. enterica]
MTPAAGDFKRCLPPDLACVEKLPQSKRASKRFAQRYTRVLLLPLINMRFSW